MPDLPGLVLLSFLLSALLYGVLRLLFPGSKRLKRSTEDFAALHRRFRFSGFRQFAVMAAITLAGSLLAYGVYQGAAWLLHSGSLSRSLYLIRADRFARLVVSLLGGAAIGLAASPLVFKKMLGADYEAYVDYQNHLTGLDNERTANGLAILLGLAYVVISALFLDWYSAFSPAGIRQAPLFSAQIREHAYTDIARLEMRDSFVRPDGKHCVHQHFIVYFKDGQQWNSRNSGYETLDRNQELFLFLKEKAGLQVP